MADKITKIAVSDTINDLKQETNGDTTKVDTPTEAPIEEKPEETQKEENTSSNTTKTTVTGEKRIEPLTKPEEQSEKPAANNIAAEPEEHPTPDSSQIMTARAEEQMQNPRIFDTKEYHLPITQSVHGHGSKVGALLFGVIFAFAVIAAAIYFLQ